jgi:hypothetical protein
LGVGQHQTRKNITKIRKNLAAPISAQKGQLFDHTSAIFSSDALHRTQKPPRLTKNCQLFGVETAG